MIYISLNSFCFVRRFAPNIVGVCRVQTQIFGQCPKSHFKQSLLPNSTLNMYLFLFFFFRSPICSTIIQALALVIVRKLYKNIIQIVSSGFGVISDSIYNTSAEFMTYNIIIIHFFRALVILADFPKALVQLFN